MKVAVVTGASAGLGETVARLLARHGFAAVLAARRKDRLDRVAAEIEEAGGTTLPAPCDVTRREDVERLAATVETTFGRCDVLVNNAGIPSGGAFADVSIEQLDRVLETNLRAVVWGSKIFLPLLEASRGHIVNVASLAGRYAFPGAAVYTAAKHGVIALSESLYHELKPRGVAVTAVNPGLFPAEAFPHEKLRRDRAARLLMTTQARVARSILEVIRTRRGPEVSVPRWQAAFQALRVLTPPLYRRGVARLAGERDRRQR